MNLTNGYNGHLTSREAGSVGGQMVKNGTPERTKFLARQSRTKEGIAIKSGTYSGCHFNETSTDHGVLPDRCSFIFSCSSQFD